MEEVESEHLKEVLAKAETDLALEKEKSMVEVEKVQKELTEVEKKAKKKVMEACKVSADFEMEKAWVVVAFRTSDGFYNDYCLSKEAFH